MHALPLELLHHIVQHLSAREMMQLAATSRLFDDLTNAVALRLCTLQGITSRGLWCGKRSWRVQLHGRSFRKAGARVHSQLGSAGTRNSRRPRAFSKPVSVAALSGGRAVVCNMGSHCLSVVRLSDGASLQEISIDGRPSGVCCLPGEGEIVAVCVQARAETGASISGVVNQMDRVEVYALDQGGQRLWSDEGRAGLSYPNGVAVRRAGQLVMADWNNHRTCNASNHR
ncbi:hypothetical protein AB1Y20_015100 [Prymnesium parvum]|uniref:F-box domain-containing protein n=1 Tax=Prymnesium parvum TaxID=97485 RepID=A0AB34JZ46_PRYPA